MSQEAAPKSSVAPEYPSGDYDEFDRQLSLWDYTEDARSSWPEGSYKGRHLIGRDTQLEGGVYYGKYPGEAIVVDTEKYPDSYNRLFNELIERTSVDGKVDKGEVLNGVFELVSEQMTYSMDGVDRLMSDTPDGQKVDLGIFIDAGVGVCRHQALTVGILLEKMKAAGHISGSVSVDRNKGWSPKGEPTGHAWVRYTNSAGRVIVIDVAQQKLLYLEDVDPLDGWNYLRPDEQEYISGARATSDQFTASAVERQRVGVQELEDRVEELEASLEGLKSQVSENDYLNLWRYTVGLLNKTEAQKRGDGPDSIFQEQQSSQAYQGLSESARDLADSYRYIFTSLQDARERLYKAQSAT